MKNQTNQVTYKCDPATKFEFKLLDNKKIYIITIPKTSTLEVDADLFDSTLVCNIGNSTYKFTDESSQEVVLKIQDMRSFILQYQVAFAQKILEQKVIETHEEAVSLEFSHNCTYEISFEDQKVTVRANNFSITHAVWTFATQAVFNAFVAKLLKFALEHKLTSRAPDGVQCSSSHFKQLVTSSGLTQAEVARRVGMSDRGLRQLIADDDASTKRGHNYAQQYVLENIRPFIQLA